jgi:hypothetical protein
MSAFMLLVVMLDVILAAALLRVTQTVAKVCVILTVAILRVILLSLIGSVALCSSHYAEWRYG